jgi:hypothetical protein
MLEIAIAAVLSALLAGALGYTVAVVKRDTAIALLRRDHDALEKEFAKLEHQLGERLDRIDKRFMILLRLNLNIAKKSGVEMRTADVLEITALIPGEAL